MEQSQPFRVTSAILMPLTVKSNWAGARQALGHFGAIGLTATALWFALGSWWALPLTLLLGYMLAFLFTAEHETAHRTAFRTHILNDFVGHIAGWLILLPYEYYRLYHWDHHRYTQNPEKDPELSFALPTSRLGLLWYWSGLPFWWGRMRLLVNHGVLGKVTAPWIAERKRGEIVAEARKYLAVYALAIALSVLLQSWILVWLWIVPVMVGQLFLRPYLMAEHTGCLHTANMLENTRTTYTNGFVRFLPGTCLSMQSTMPTRRYRFMHCRG